MHARPSYTSNFGGLQLADGVIVDRSSGAPYSGRLVARDAELNAIGCWVLADSPMEDLCTADATGMVLDAEVEQGRLVGSASLRADLASERFGPAVHDMFGDLSGLAQDAVQTVQVAKASFSDGHLEGTIELYEPSADPGGSTLRAQATISDNRLHGVVRAYERGVVIRELSFDAGVRSGPQRWFFADGSLAEEVSYVDGRPDGEAVAYYSDGARRHREVWDAGQRVGVWEAWYPDGTLRRRQAFDGTSPQVREWFSNGGLARETTGDEVRELLPDGLVMEYYDTGQVRTKARYVQGALEGTREVYYRDGSRWALESYAAGKAQGVHRKWWKNGQAALEAHYAGGELDGSYERWYANGKAWEKATYAAGKRVGDYRKWWKNGALAHEYRYVDGKLDGDYRTYYDSGAKWAVAQYRRGKPIGVHRRWFPDGSVGYVKHHERGRPHGTFKRWWADGSPRLDATYVDGKLHGHYENWLEDGTVYEVATYEAGTKVSPQIPEDMAQTAAL